MVEIKKIAKIQEEYREDLGLGFFFFLLFQLITSYVMGLVGFGFHIRYFLHLQATSCISFLAFKMTILKCKITFWNDYGFWLLE